MIRKLQDAAARPHLVTLTLFATLSFAAIIVPARAMVGGAQPAAAGAGRSVVMILGSSGTMCTATAIARDLLLTAAHCVLPGANYKLLDRLPAPGHEPVLKTILQIKRNPGFELKRLFEHLATADVALAKLAEPLPAQFAPVALDDGSHPVVVGAPLVIAGYGVAVRGEGRTTGVVRAATLVATGQPGPLQIRLMDPRTKGNTLGLGACTGDSGAPAFRDEGDELAIVGVVSWSTGPKLAAGCGGLTGVTPLVRYLTWIVKTARALGSPLAP